MSDLPISAKKAVAKRHGWGPEMPPKPFHNYACLGGCGRCEPATVKAESEEPFCCPSCREAIEAVDRTMDEIASQLGVSRERMSAVLLTQEQPGKRPQWFKLRALDAVDSADVEEISARLVKDTETRVRRAAQISRRQWAEMKAAGLVDLSSPLAPTDADVDAMKVAAA